MANATAKTEPIDADQPLRVFWNSSEHWVGHSIADVKAMFFANYGDDPETQEQAEDFSPCDDASELSINTDTERGVVKQTCAAWVAENGRGFLCSEDY